MTEIDKDLKNKKEEIKLKEQQALEFYLFLKDSGYILFEAIVGSQAHGTSTPESDIDKAFIYILPKEHLYGTYYIPQLKVNADYTGFEIRRFLELVHSNNPTILELLNTPEDCIITKHPVFDQVVENRDKFLTKICKNSFAGYAKKQITKAKGLDKKQNWEKDKSRITRKEILDFCYVIEGNKSKPLRGFLSGRPYEQLFCGVVNIPNARDMHALYFDEEAAMCFSEGFSEESKEKRKAYLTKEGRPLGFGFKGIVKVGDSDNAGISNQLRLSSIPKLDQLGNALEPIAIFTYNKDGYTQHCKDYKEYQEWLENRNETRYVDNKEHNQKYDGKNLMHCKRLLQIAREIAETGSVNIRRPNREELLDIRKGKVELGGLIEWAENEMRELDVAFDNSNLPKEIDGELINQMLIKIRTEFYSEKDI